MKFVFKLLKGIFVGVANIIPGLCSGSVAIVCNVYDDMLMALSLSFEYIKKHWLELLCLLIGILIGIFAFSYVISWMFDNYYYSSLYLFIGLIIGGVPALFKKSKKMDDTKNSVWKWFFMILSFAIIIALSFIKMPESTTIIDMNFQDSILIFLAGIVGAFGMILPGLSGSFLLLLFGYYATVINAVKSLQLLVLLPFGAGAIIGLIFGAKLMKWLLNKFPKVTYFAIIGLVLASMVALFPGFRVGWQIVIDIVIFAIGVVITFLLGKFANEDEYESKIDNLKSEKEKLVSENENLKK